MTAETAIAILYDFRKTLQQEEVHSTHDPPSTSASGAWGTVAHMMSSAARGMDPLQWQGSGDRPLPPKK